MQAPKCRLCGKVEWQHVCGGLEYVQASIAKALAAEAPSSGVQTKSKTKAQPKERPDSGVMEQAPEGPKFDRNKAHKIYMRQYMRDRRAAAKAGMTLEEWKAKDAVVF